MVFLEAGTSGLQHSRAGDGNTPAERPFWGKHIVGFVR